MGSLFYKIFLFLLVCTGLFAILPPSKRWRPATFSKNKKRFAGVGVIIVKENNVLLVYRDKTEINFAKHGLIGGLVHEGEAAKDAAIRIVDEEVGVVVKKENLALAHCMSARQEGDIDVIQLYFVVTQWEGEPRNNAPEKHQYIAWFPINQLPENLIDRNRIAIESMKNGILYSEYGYD